MNREQLLEVVEVEVGKLAPETALPVTEHTPLSGEGRVLKSHDLVVLMLAIEDRFSENGKVLQWPLHIHRTFETVGTLLTFLESQL